MAQTVSEQRVADPLSHRRAAERAGALLALGGVLLGGAAAKQGCASSQTTSPDGTVVHGSACADEIVATSPLVKKVYAGEGDDVVYAGAEVEEIYGGEGNDVIYGDHGDGGKDTCVYDEGLDAVKLCNP